MFFIAAGLAMDCFAVALGIGATRAALSTRSVFRVVFHFGFFQGLMAFLGWLSGTTIVGLISRIDHWIAAGLLAVVGVHMIVDGLKQDCEETPVKDPTRGSSLVLLSIATSIDALAIGLSLAVMKADIFTSSFVIAVVSAVFSIAGMLLGSRLGACFGRRMEIVGGLILNGIGLRILFMHLFL